MDLSNLTFPLFPISKKIDLVVDGLRRLVRTYKNDEVIELLVDDLSIPLKTLGERRLKILSRGDRLFRLPGAVYSLRDLIKQGTAYHYIDFNGKLFDYKKSNYYYTVHYHKIITWKSYVDQTILKLEDIHCSIESDRSPETHETHAGLLYIENGYLLYDFATYKKEPYRRKI